MNGLQHADAIASFDTNCLARYPASMSPASSAVVHGSGRESMHWSFQQTTLMLNKLDSIAR